jgi:hypothetical protein
LSWISQLTKWNMKIMESMITKALAPLFEGFSISMLLAMLLLLNLKIINGLNNVFMDELYSFLWKKILPKGNKMPTTTYKALKLIKELGLSYYSIHTCTTSCMFFGGALKDSRMCPKCNTYRFVDELSSIVFRHFTLIPRLLRMYRCKTLVELLIWHKHGANTNGLVWNVPDFKSWKHIYEKWREFALKHEISY